MGRGPGQYFITGAQGCGKTTLARKIADELVMNLQWPLLGIDSHGDLADFYGRSATGSVQDALRISVRDGQSVLFDPPEDEPLERIAHGLFDAHPAKVVLFIDEIAYSCKYDTMKKWTRALFRKYRKAQVAVVGTTQYISDISPLALQGTYELHSGFQSSELAVKRLSTEYGMDPAKLKTLGRGEFLSWRRPFTGE